MNSQDATYKVGPRGETQRVIDHSSDALTPRAPRTPLLSATP